MMHEKAHKQFTEDKQAKNMNYWNHILWSNDTKINLFGSDGGGSVMVWGCMSELQFTEGTTNANMCSDILKESMIPSLQKLSQTHL